MSIHRSKGLEFPIVFLGGLARQVNRQDMAQPVLFHPRLGVGPKRLDLERMIEWPTLARLAVARQMDRETAAEELRLLYVGMTRAKEKLILTAALSKGRKDLERLEPYAGTPTEPQALLECTSPAQWLLLPVLARPEMDFLRSGSAPPCRVALGAAWDIHWEDAALFASVPKREVSQNVAAQTADSKKQEELLARFRWTYPHPQDTVLPSKLTATELKGRGLDQEAAEETVPPPREILFDRPRFAVEKLGLTPAERGTALHLTMQYIDFSKCNSLRGISEEIVRLTAEKFLTPEQGEAVAPSRLWRFFTARLGREIIAAQTLRREFKFSILVPARRYYPQAGSEEKILLQGVIDAFFEQGGGWTVVDFKTDWVFGEKLRERAEKYRSQLDTYSMALEEITGRPVKRKVLWFFSEGRTVEL